MRDTNRSAARVSQEPQRVSLPVSEHPRRWSATARIPQVPESDLRDFEVDPSRVLYGVRRYWWIIVALAFAGLVAGVVSGSSQTVFDVELRESASRSRLGGRAYSELALLNFQSLVDVMNSPERHDAVDAAAREAVTYSASLTPSGLVALRVVAPTEETAREMSQDVVGVMNSWLADEQGEVVGQRVAELTQSTKSLGDEIEAIDFTTGDDVAAILERASLIDALVQDQRDLAQLTAALDQAAPGSTEVRTATASSSSRNQSLLGAVGGALVGLAIAAGLGLARRKIRDVTDVRRIVGPLPVFVSRAGASPSASAALVSGLMAEAGWDLRSRTRFTSVGTSVESLHETLLETSSKFGLGLEAADAHESTTAQSLVLVAANADWADVLAGTAGSNVVLAVTNGDQMGDVQEQLRLLHASRLDLVGCVLVS